MAIDGFVSDIQVVIADFFTLSNLDPHRNCNNLLNFLAIKYRPVEILCRKY